MVQRHYDAKLVKSFESILVITLYGPESGKRYFTEKVPSGAAVILVNLKDLCCPSALLSTTTLAERSLSCLPVCRFCTLNLSSVGASIIGFAGEYLNWIFRLFNLSIHICCVALEEEEELCPRTVVFRGEMTTTVMLVWLRTIMMKITLQKKKMLRCVMSILLHTTTYLKTLLPLITSA